MKKILLTLALGAISCFSFAQNGNYWSVSTKKSGTSVIESKSKMILPKVYALDIEGLKSSLTNAPIKVNIDEKSDVIATFPNSNGEMEHFRIIESSNFEPILAAKYPDIKSYAGQGVEDPTSTIYFSISPLGLSSMVINKDQSGVFIEPYSKDLSEYVVFKKNDKTTSLNKFECKTLDTATNKLSTNLTARPNADDSTLRTYRLALSCTGEYTAYFGGTKALALAAMNNTMTRVNGVFLNDFAAKLVLIANDDVLIYTNATTDPYSASASMSNWNQELQTNLTNTIGSGNYDIGHLFGATGGGGNAGCIGCVCTNPTTSVPLGKGSGITSPADAIPSGDNFDIDYVAHEMGHQLGGNHTFTFSTESGTGAQMEPGSGSTIMGYAGITSKDIQMHSDPYFHAISIQQITNNLKAKTCSVNTATGNAIPTANAGLDYTIPKGTPFVLKGVGTDANGDLLTYVWEQFDVGTSATSTPSATATSGPIFRSYYSKSSSERYFPNMTTILGGLTTTQGDEIPVEVLPNVARTLNFRLTVRDNKTGGGGNNSDDMIVTVNGTAGPFIVTSPNTAVSYVGGSTQTVTWNVAGTTANNVNAANVDILISTNGGISWSTLLAATPNDGSQAVTIPNTPSTICRIMVKGSNNIFFDISNADFTITAGTTDTVAPTAPILSASGTTQTTTNLSWSGATDNVAVTGYDVYQGTTLIGSTISTTYSVSGLSASTTYTFTVKAKDAAGNVSVASNTVSVTTLAPVIDTIAPTAPILSASATTTSATTLTWSGATDNVAVTGYDVYQGTTLIGSTTSTTYSVSGLSASTTYTFTVKAKDAAGNVSVASNTVSVTTSANSSLSYCTSQGITTTDEKIGKVDFGTISNTSTGTTGYENFTSLSTNVIRGTANNITITPDWNCTKYKEGYAVWIDYNQNGTFESSELVWSKAASTTSPVSGSITIPATATLGATRMRVSMKYHGIPSSCETFPYGQVEDYTVIISSTAKQEFTTSITNELIIYPNPVSSILNIKNAESNDYRVYYMGGKIISTGKIVDGNVNVNALPKGVYLIQVGKSSKRFIKE